MVEKGKSSFGGGSMTNTVVAGIDLGDTKSLVTVLSPSGDVTDRISFAMTEEGCMFSLADTRIVRNVLDQVSA